MSKSPLIHVALIAAFAALMLAAGCGEAGEVAKATRDAQAAAPDASAERLLPGAPLSPIANQDWYQLLAKESSQGISFAQMRKEIGYAPLVVMGDDGQPLEPNSITRVAQTLADGSVVMGYTLRYDGRIALAISPTDRVMDAARESKDRTIDPDVKGNDRPWRVTSVLGTDGLARNATVQKWQSGDQMRAPSAVDWQEASEGPTPYVRYLLLGDVPVGRLQSIAVRMDRL